MGKTNRKGRRKPWRRQYSGLWKDEMNRYRENPKVQRNCLRASRIQEESGVGFRRAGKRPRRLGKRRTLVLRYGKRIGIGFHEKSPICLLSA